MADKAVLTGINNYQWISDLRGCVNDVENVRTLLSEVFGFPAQNIRVLTDAEVTKERVQQQWDWLFQDAAAGDRLVFHFSGHGSYTTDLDDDEPDGVDELLCLYDMDWDDSQTYLLDDDLRTLTGRVPAGVSLTVILDSCHSGTATRMLLAPGAARAAFAPEKTPLVDVHTSLARLEAGDGIRTLSLRGDEAGEMMDRILTARDPVEARHTVLARFVEPPPVVLDALYRVGVRRGLRPRRDERDEPEMNHVLLAGSQANQTSADAFIAGDYHGAFSYYFCETARALGDRADHQELIRRVRETLSHERFRQVPQLEPESTRGPLFQRNGSNGGDESSAAAGPSAQSGAAPEVVDLLREIRDLLRGGTLPAVSGGRATGARALVYVHGICRHDDGFSDGWWRSLRTHLSPPLRDALESNRHEVLWSDLVTPERALRFAADPRELQREQELADLLREVLEDRAERQTLEAVPIHEAGTPPTPAPRAAERAALGIPGLNCVDDFAKYLLNEDIRRAVQQRFLEIVVPLLRRGTAVEVISHSWGTVVAWEALRRLDGESFDGRVHNLFTVGSALSIVPVKNRVRPRDGRRPRHVQCWVNLDARGDVVGGPLRGFAVDLEFLNLHPAGCSSFLGIVSPACAHGSYFQQGNAAVNRDVFANRIAT